MAKNVTHRKYIPDLGISALSVNSAAAFACILSPEEGSATFNHDSHLIWKF